MNKSLQKYNLKLAQKEIKNLNTLVVPIKEVEPEI